MISRLQISTLFNIKWAMSVKILPPCQHILNWTVAPYFLICLLVSFSPCLTFHRSIGQYLLASTPPPFMSSSLQIKWSISASIPPPCLTLHRLSGLYLLASLPPISMSYSLKIKWAISASIHPPCLTFHWSSGLYLLASPPPWLILSRFFCWYKLPWHFLSHFLCTLPWEYWGE